MSLDLSFSLVMVYVNGQLLLSLSDVIFISMVTAASLSVAWLQGLLCIMGNAANGLFFKENLNLAFLF